MRRGSRKSGFAGMSPERRREAQSRGGKEAQRRRRFAKAQLLLPKAAPNIYLAGPEAQRASSDAWKAERAERAGNRAEASRLFRTAGRRYARCVETVPAEYPNTRADLVQASTACLERAAKLSRKRS